jgi:hypothetical protein
VYDTARDTMTVIRGTVNSYFPRVSATSTGSQFLLGASLFDDSLTFIRSYAPTGYGGGPTVISPDGLSVYMATDFGYFKVRTSDGAVLEQVLLPAPLNQMTVLPSGDWLIGIAGDQFSGALTLEVVDLR